MTDARTLRDALLAEPCIRRRFPDDVNGIPGTGNLQWLRQRLDRIIAAARADALTAFGHHADDCEYALTVCTCGFTEAMRTLFEKENAMTTATICTDPTCPIPVRHETFPEHTPEDTLRKMGLPPSIVAELTGTTSEPCSDSHDFMLRCRRCGVKGSIHLSIAGADEEVSVVKRAAIVPCPDCGAEPHEGACETDR